MREHVEAAVGRKVASATRVGGGCINEGYRVEFEDGETAFVKTRAQVAPDEYEIEAAGLAWLAGPRAVNVPRVLGHNEHVLAIEWVDEGRLSDQGAEEFGRELARLHDAGASSFGGDKPIRIGELELPNERSDDWPSFYAESRLFPLLTAVDARTAEAVEAVAAKLEDLTPKEPPARLHGDLWSGNVLPDTNGEAWLIDPVAYGGHREIDLAMLRLFGAPSPRIEAAYNEEHPLESGFEERVGLWQLFPLLVHAALFGGHYVAQVERTARRYAA